MKKQWELNEAVQVLPIEFRQALEKQDTTCVSQTEELRLRRGYPMMINVGGRELDTESPIVTEEHLRTVLENASQSSVHTVLEQMKQGFITLKGGHRIGLCGAAVRRDGELVNLRYLTSLSIRVARPVFGPGEQVAPQLMEKGTLMSTLILAPPGVGKTTLLRDLIRVLSDGGLRVSIADERGEIAALWQGLPQFDVGRHTDVLDGCPKGEGVTILLRAMNPQVIAVDEITDPADVQVVTEVCGCGVSLLATAHGSSRKDLEHRLVYRTLLECGVFRRLILLERQGSCRRMRVEVLS